MNLVRSSLAWLFALACLHFPASAEVAAPAPAPTPVPKSTIATIKAQGFVRCGGVLRPGLAMTDGKGRWTGLEVEICRAMAIAVLGEAARMVFHDYGSDRDFDPLRSGEDQLAFLTFAEMAGQKLTDNVLPGPPVFIESLDMLVAASSPAKGFGDLAGKGICFMIGTAAENELEAWFHDHELEFVPFAFQEDGEEFDTFKVQKCAGVVSESTALGNVRLDPGVNDLRSRFIAGHLRSYPIVAATPIRGDAQWAAVVAWTIATLVNADTRQTDYRAGGLKAMAVEGKALGLPAGWQKTVLDHVGSYSDIFRRTLGAGSPLKLDQGLNRGLDQGGVLVAPFRD